MSTPPFQHLVLTKFNCRMNLAWASTPLGADWLGPRFVLFERYCLPSVLRQDCRNFKWIIFFDIETPEPYRSMGAALETDIVKPIFVECLSSELVRETIRQHIPAGASHVITTRLDNDDGLATDHIRRVQGSFRPLPQKEFLNVTEGFLLSRGKLYRRHDRHNAFVSLAEPVGDIEGVWAYSHTEIHRYAPVRQIGSGPGWLQVVHESNASNKLRGTRVPPSEPGDNFILDRSTLASSQGNNYWWERHFMSRWWFARDSAAATLRMTKRLMGKDPC